ncbi:MAG: hypothetical protein QOI38_3080 [Sphingomonadales bacterium]|nr:hypothetical protein [Sphingomonadales bacterium]
MSGRVSARTECLVILLQPLLYQPPDRFGAGGFWVGLAVDPGGDRRLQLGGNPHSHRRVAAGPGAARTSFLSFGY